VSAIGTASNITGKVRSRTSLVLSIEIINTALTIRYPRKNDPESPRNILAGKALYLRNPIKHPVIDERTTKEKVSKKLRLIKNRSVKTSSEIPETRPSRPSRRLKAFIVPTINNTRMKIPGTIENSTVNKVRDENFGIRKSRSREAATV
jgi:hypothetical protein